jgi:hypothetical protein
MFDLSEPDTSSPVSLQSRRASQVFGFITKAQLSRADNASNSPLHSSFVIESPDPCPLEFLPEVASCVPELDRVGVENTNTLPVTELGVQPRGSLKRSKGSFRLFHLPGRPKYRERQLEKLLLTLKEEVNATTPTRPSSPFPCTSALALPKVIPRKPIKYEGEFQLYYKEKGIVDHPTQERNSVRPLRTVNPNVPSTGLTRGASLFHYPLYSIGLLDHSRIEKLCQTDSPTINGQNIRDQTWF